MTFNDLLITVVFTSGVFACFVIPFSITTPGYKYVQSVLLTAFWFSVVLFFTGLVALFLQNFLPYGG